MESRGKQTQFVAILVALAAHTACADEPTAKIDFAHDVIPLLKEHCYECHGGHRHEGDFSINTREMIVDSSSAIPGNADASYIIEMITTDDKDLRMPKDKPRLDDATIQKFKDWINAGVPWEPGFTFATKYYEPPLRPRRPELPPAVDGRDNPVDRILDAYLKHHEVQQPAPLDDATFARRVYLDTIGLVPTPDQLHTFVADTDPNKRAKLIEALLADNQAYAEHWLSFWNDLLRNDYVGTGYIDGGRKQISGCLYHALKFNMPFDEFVRALIAPAPESAGFIRGMQWRGNVNATQTP